MKKIIIVLIAFISFNCDSQKKATIDYSTYSNPELLNKKTALELEANYVLVNDYLEQIEREDVSHMALTKIKSGLTNSYLENAPELQACRANWKKASSIISKFEKTHAPELADLGKQLRNKSITEDEYFKKNREYRAKLIADYPSEYPQLSKNHITSLKTMWKETGRFMLEDYKKKGMLFPITWIPEKDRENSEKIKKYRAISQEVLTVQKEIEKKNSKP